MPNESFPVEFDRAEAGALLGVFSRVLSFAEARVAAMSAGTIAAEVVPLVDPLPRPRPVPPRLLSNCEPRILESWPDVATSVAVANVGAYLVALLKALEEGGTIPSRIPDIPGALGPDA